MPGNLLVRLRMETAPFLRERDMDDPLIVRLPFLTDQPFVHHFVEDTGDVGAIIEQYLTQPIHRHLLYRLGIQEMEDTQLLSTNTELFERALDKIGDLLGRAPHQHRGFIAEGKVRVIYFSFIRHSVLVATEGERLPIFLGDIFLGGFIFLDVQRQVPESKWITGMRGQFRDRQK